MNFMVVIYLILIAKRSIWPTYDVITSLKL